MLTNFINTRSLIAAWILGKPAHSSCGKHTVVFPSVENAVRLSASLLAFRRDHARSASETVFRPRRAGLAAPLLPLEMSTHAA